MYFIYLGYNEEIITKKFPSILTKLDNALPIFENDKSIYWSKLKFKT